MCCRLPTKSLCRSLLCLGLLGLPGAAGAQVYKSYDAEGNVVFSDKPTRDSVEVEISKPNLSDSFEIPPPPPPPPVEPKIDARPETPLQPEQARKPVAEERSADTNKDGRISRRELEAEREARRKARREAARAAEQARE